MAFVKLDCGILDSSLWVDREAREVFVTALLMARPVEIREPMEQYSVREMEATGFVVPAGWYGWVAAAGPGIVKRAGIDSEAGLSALERLGAPEPHSRTPDFEGRRLVRVRGGYVALNYALYREKDYTAADRSKRYRERKGNGNGAVKAKREKGKARTEHQKEEVGEEGLREIAASEFHKQRERELERAPWEDAPAKEVAAVSEEPPPEGEDSNQAPAGCV